MAPRVSKDYHSVVEPNSHSLKILAKRGEDHFAQRYDVDVANVTGKEEFLRSMGLRMKRYQYEYKMLNGRTRKINIPQGVTLQDCSVIVPGSTCKICGKSFKCVTDLIAHDAWKHRIWLRTDYNVDKEPIYERDSDSDRDNGGDNSHNTCEIVAESTEYSDVSTVGSPAREMNRKLRVTLRIGTEVVARMTLKRKHLRTSNDSLNMATQTEPTHNVDELIIRKDEGAVPRIDLPVFDISPCQCCNSGLHVVNSANQYLAGNIVTSQDTKREENTKDGFALDRVRGPCATTASGKVDAVPDGLLINKSQPEQNYAKDCNKDGLFCLPNATEIPRPCERDINANEKFVDASGKEFEGSDLVNRVIVPIIPPIVVPNDKAVSTEKSRASERPSSASSAESNEDDVQEVLRIVRGQNSHEEINHESPNRNEQEMLLRDAIKDMIRMEEQGWHLLEKEPPKKKVRVNGRSNARNRVQNEDSAKRKKKAVPFDGEVVIRNAKKTKGLLSEVQNLYQNRICTADNAKENLMICNRNINVPSEVLHRYGINYYTETFEINNNTQTVQEHVSCLVAPCSAGMENRSNKPTIIDLVNDTDEWAAMETMGDKR